MSVDYLSFIFIFIFFYSSSLVKYIYLVVIWKEQASRPTSEILFFLQAFVCLFTASIEHFLLLVDRELCFVVVPWDKLFVFPTFLSTCLSLPSVPGQDHVIQPRPSCPGTGTRRLLREPTDSLAWITSSMQNILVSVYESIPKLTEIQSPYVSANRPYCTTAFPATSILTPVSLPDSAFAPTRPSPVLSHHSQEYQHSLNDSAPPHGLGIAAPFPGNYPRSVSTAIRYPSEDMYRSTDAALSPHQRPAKRTRRFHKQPAPMRENPVSILPHPEGLQRLEQERRRGQAEAHAHQRPRAPGRGRKDPQAEEEDAYVESLREQNLAWKVIREMFRERFNKDASEARLQMRLLRRRKERLARWDESDVSMCAVSIVLFCCLRGLWCVNH